MANKDRVLLTEECPSQGDRRAGMNRLLHPKSEGKRFQVGNEDGGRAGLQSLAGEFKENYLCLRL